MELNERGQNRAKPVRNPEGSIVAGRLPEIQLYLEASNLNLKGDSFYQSANKKLDSILEMVKKDVSDDFVFGLSKFLTDNGFKLSPVVLLSALANKGYSFDSKYVKTFNTPQRIAEAIALNNRGTKLNNSFKKHILRKSLENMTKFTLTKNQLKNRKIKTRDLIKLLRPHPKDGGMGDVYKKIIENKAKAPQTLVSVKSDSTKTAENKIEYYIENIDTIPINMLIRNLKFIAENADFKTNIDFQNKIIDKLNSVEDYRFLNIFDVITAAIHVPRFEQALFEIVKKFVKDVKERFGEVGDATVLFDFSWSMEGKGFENGFKYLVLMSLLFDNVTLRSFADSLHRLDLNGQVKDIKKGMIGRAHKVLHEFFHNNSGGTSLIRSTDTLVTESSEIKNLIVISDEVSWKEGEDLRYDIRALGNKLKDKNLIVINPEVYRGTVFNDNVLALASLTSSIIYNIYILANAQGFVKFIRNYKHE